MHSLISCMMSSLSLGTHILAVYLIFLAPQIQGGQFLRTSKQTWYEHVLGSGYEKDNPYHASHVTNAGSYFGLVVTMDVYGYNLIHGQVSTTTITVGNLEGDFKSNEDAIWVGWQVYPNHYGDSRTRFFTLWTRDAYRTTGCFDMECPGFEQTRGAGLKPAAVIDPLSHHKITIKVLQVIKCATLHTFFYL
uniref:Neprosin PEP catalytic domain-containing protein n=1 Tax=Aegilops tauschii subsp. strangulata TaxID=200361 RepID=A0A453A2Z6_AEGTS